MSPTQDPLTALDNLGLANALDPKGKPTKSRIKDVNAALAIYTRLADADRNSAVQRARIDAMFDGAAPYDQAKLESTGQGLKTNLNFGESQRLLDISLSAYVDLYSSLERFVEVRGTTQEPNARKEMEEIVGEEITLLLRSWPEFHSSYLRLCTTFIKHGVGVAYFDSPDGWKFRVGGFQDILIPRQTPASEEAVDVAVLRRSYHLHELYKFIKSEPAATKQGWNVAEVKRVMLANVKTTGRDSAQDYEALQAELKNNDLYLGVQNPTVDMLHYLVRETDGTISHYISAESSPQDFMYGKQGRYQTAEQAFVMFSFGVGSNGTYHSVRGLGQRIFSHIQTSNRLRCQMVDGAMLGSSVMIQPQSQRALEELDFTFYGSYAVISPDVDIVTHPFANLGTSVKPALDDMQQQLALNTDVVSTYGPEQGSPYRNQMQVAADMDVATRLSGASLNLFYSSWSRLLRELVARIVRGSKDPTLKDFYQRCADRGVPKEFITSLDVAKTKAVRSIGNGSQANRLVALRELQGIQGQFDETGRLALTRDIVSTRVGHDFADRYVPRSTEGRTTVDDKIVFFENQQLSQGQPVPPMSSELHGAHLNSHVPALQQLLAGLDAGEIDPTQALPVLHAFYEHIGQTIQLAAGDPNLKGAIGYAKQALQYAEEAINNTTKHLEAQQRQEQEQPQEQPEGPDPQMQAKLQAHQIDMSIKREKADLEIALKKEKFDADQALRDAETALKFRQENT